VREVLQQQLCLRFALSIRPQIPGNQFAVRFGFNRLPMRRQHQALEEPFDEDRVFFPVADHVKALLPGVTPAFKNGAIATNPAQKLAVETIMRLPPGSPPFVVFGPPGTGKVGVSYL
jgi:helicase MOV-10